MGEAGQLRYRDQDAPVGGDLERAYRASTVVKFGGGTNEVQRNIIAQQGLGMPR
jgi:alkylation response protein AidB-like acyl-CoA dehydrogenase